MVEKLIWAGHLRRYLREPTRGATVVLIADKAVVEIEHAPGPQPTINFILGDRPMANINPRNIGEECSGQPRLEPE